MNDEKDVRCLQSLEVRAENGRLSLTITDCFGQTTTQSVPMGRVVHESPDSLPEHRFLLPEGRDRDCDSAETVYNSLLKRWDVK